MNSQLGVRAFVEKKKKIKPKVLAVGLDVNRGHDEADLIREADPRGGTVEHLVVATQRMIDRLRRAGRIETHQYEAAKVLRDAYERAGLAVGNQGARDLRRPFGADSGPVDDVANDKAWKKYNNAMRQMGQQKAVLRAVVIDDEIPEQWGARHNCHGQSALDTALDKLARHFGLMPTRATLR